jgi:signal transduction histidine kinase
MRTGPARPHAVTDGQIWRIVVGSWEGRLVATSVAVVESSSQLAGALGDAVAAEPDLHVAGVAADAAGAAALVRDHEPDVAVVDPLLPGAVAAVRGASPSTAVLALSAHGDRATVTRALRDGAIGFLLQGTPTDELLEAIRRTGRGESTLSRHLTTEIIDELVRLLEVSERAAEEAADRDRARGRLVQILNHEMLTPVTIVQGAAMTLSARGRALPAEAMQGLVDSVTRATARLGRIARNVEAASAFAADEVDITTVPVPVGEVVARAAEEFPVHADRLRRPSGATPLAWADFGLATRAVANLFENALELSPPDAPVEVDVEGDEAVVSVRVADRGPGVSREVRQRLFAPLWQGDDSTTRAHPGMGLGLFLAGRIMQAHGGGLEVDDRVGGGAVFTLHFAAFADEPNAALEVGSHG